MYIDTHTKESMEASICNLLNMNSLELHEQLMLLDKSSKDEDDINYKIIMHIFYQINMYKFKFTLLRRGRNFAVDKISL